MAAAGAMETAEGVDEADCTQAHARKLLVNEV